MHHRAGQGRADRRALGSRLEAQVRELARHREGRSAALGDHQAQLLPRGRRQASPNVPAARELLLENVYPGIDLRLYGQEESSSSSTGSSSRAPTIGRSSCAPRASTAWSWRAPTRSCSRCPRATSAWRFRRPTRSTMVKRWRSTPRSRCRRGTCSPTTSRAASIRSSPRHRPHARVGHLLRRRPDRLRPVPVRDQGRALHRRRRRPIDFCVYAAGVTDENHRHRRLRATDGYITPQAAPFDTHCTTCGANSATNVDAIVYVLAEDGSTVYYATHFGGTGRDEAYALPSPADGFAGLHRRYHRSADLPDGTTAPYDGDLNGTFDGFVAVFDPTLTTLQYFTYIGTDNNGDPDGTVTLGDHHWEDIISIRTFGIRTSFAIGGTFGGTFGTSAANPNNGAGADTEPLYITANAADGTRAATADITDGAATDIFMYMARFTGFTTLDLRHLRRSGRGHRAQRHDPPRRREDSVHRRRRLRRRRRTAPTTASQPWSTTSASTAVSSPPTTIEGIVGIIELAGAVRSAQPHRRRGPGRLQRHARPERLPLPHRAHLLHHAQSQLTRRGGRLRPVDTTYGGGLSDAIVARVPYSGCSASPACTAGSWRATYLGGTGADLGNALEAFLEGVFLFGSTTSADARGEPLPHRPPLVSPPSMSVAARSSTPPKTAASTSSSPLSVASSTAWSSRPSSVVRTTTIWATPAIRAAPTTCSRTVEFLWLGTTVHSGQPARSRPPSTSLAPSTPTRAPADAAGNDVHLISEAGWRVESGHAL